MEAAEAIRRYFNGVNQEDWDDFRGIWHDDAVIEVVGGIRVQGWDEILPYYTGALAGFPVHYDDPYKVHVAGDTITVEIAFTGETVDGVPTTFEAVDVFTMEDGLVRRLTTWYDLGRVLGFLRTPGAPERRLRTVVGRAATSPYYRSKLEELSLSPDPVADDLAQLPVTRLEGMAADELVAVPEKQLTHVIQRGDGAWPLTRDDVAERGRLWATALGLAGVGRGEIVAATEATPGLAEGVAAVRARLAFAADPAAVGATVVVGSFGCARASGDRRRRLALHERQPPRARREPHRRDRRRRARRDAARCLRGAGAEARNRDPGRLGRWAVRLRQRPARPRARGSWHDVSMLLSPVQVGSVEARNRVAFTAHGSFLEFYRPGIPGDRYVAYEERRAAGGVGADLPADDARAPLEPLDRPLHLRARRPAGEARRPWRRRCTGTARRSCSS